MRIFHLFRIRIILLFVVLYDFSIFFREPTLSRSCLVSGGWYHIRLHFESCLRICGSINGAGCNQFWPGLGWKVLLLGPHVPGRWAALPPVTQLPSVTSRDNSQCDNRLCVCRAQTPDNWHYDLWPTLFRKLKLQCPVSAVSETLKCSFPATH